MLKVKLNESYRGVGGGRWVEDDKYQENLEKTHCSGKKKVCRKIPLTLEIN